MTPGGSPFARAFAGALRSDLRLRLDEARPEHAPRDAPALEAALALAEIASRSAPEGAEVLFAVSRPAVAVAPISACVVVARWQVRARGIAAPGVVPIESDALGADRLVASPAAARLREHFATAGFESGLRSVPGVDEVRFEAKRR